MDEAKPRRRSEILADENVRRIAEQLRAERNDAIALAQQNAEILAEAAKLLAEVRRTLAEGELARRIDMFLTDHGP
jgi:cytochrome c-type biogenesis protein CcmH/NrfF